MKTSTVLLLLVITLLLGPATRSIGFWLESCDCPHHCGSGLTHQFHDHGPNDGSEFEELPPATSERPGRFEFGVSAGVLTSLLGSSATAPRIVWAKPMLPTRPVIPYHSADRPSLS